VMFDLVGIAYAAVAAVCARVAFVTWRRRAHNPLLASILTLIALGSCWWAACIGVAAASTDETVAAIALLATFPGVCLIVAAFVCEGFAIARPQWMPRRRVVVALFVEPVLFTLAAATNPWHLLVYRGAGAAQLTGPAGWTFGPVFWLNIYYSYFGMTAGIALLAWGWWKALPAFRTQRLILIVAALPPFVASAVYVYGGSQFPDPTPLCLAFTCTMVWWAVFRQNLLTFSPVARALIVDQIGDAVVVISTGGRVLDLNTAALTLVRGVNPDAPTKLIGAPAQEVFGERIASTDGLHSEIVVELPDGRAEFQVRASPLIDRHHRELGTVLVARDVTEANALSRRLAAAHSQLVRQVETIEALRADLVELASRDPLTGLHNRRHMVEHFGTMLVAAEVAGGTLAVVLFDVDEFKSVNDEFGHLAGDAVLVALAQRMQAQAPAGALVARWGGEEFFVALPGADAATGLAFADDLRHRCGQEEIEAEGRTIRCTLSGGVAAYPASGTTMDDLFHAADHSMYEAKNAGRNLVRLHRGQGRFTEVDPAVLL
jgi:diguanylate cyclase (GGDEF)-like protein